ncbi:hypothetical protein NC651_036502 [Populus alba x Populus x berolinensis]|nr:hypothetical protein NC651_036502 [Populus alba x Populus x berolinensis]
MAERERETLPLPPALPRVSSSSSRARATALVRPGPDPLLVICRCFSFVTSLTAILCVAVNVLSAVRSFKDGSDVFDGIFRCYAVVIAFIVVVAETEWGFVIKFWKILEYWAGRGMLQIFVAVMTRAFPDYSSNQKELVLLQNIASYMLLACDQPNDVLLLIVIPISREFCALAFSNGLVRRKKLRGSRLSRIWRFSSINIHGLTITGIRAAEGGARAIATRRKDLMQFGLVCVHITIGTS